MGNWFDPTRGEARPDAGTGGLTLDDGTTASRVDSVASTPDQGAVEAWTIGQWSRSDHGGCQIAARRSTIGPRATRGGAVDVGEGEPEPADGHVSHPIVRAQNQPVGDGWPSSLDDLSRLPAASGPLPVEPVPVFAPEPSRLGLDPRGGQGLGLVMMALFSAVVIIVLIASAHTMPTKAPPAGKSPYGPATSSPPSSSPAPTAPAASTPAPATAAAAAPSSPATGPTPASPIAAPATSVPTTGSPVPAAVTAPPTTLACPLGAPQATVTYTATPLGQPNLWQVTLSGTVANTVRTAVQITSASVVVTDSGGATQVPITLSPNGTAKPVTLAPGQSAPLGEGSRPATQISSVGHPMASRLAIQWAWPAGSAYGACPIAG